MVAALVVWAVGIDAQPYWRAEVCRGKEAARTERFLIPLFPGLEWRYVGEMSPGGNNVTLGAMSISADGVRVAGGRIYGSWQELVAGEQEFDRFYAETLLAAGWRRSIVVDGEGLYPFTLYREGERIWGFIRRDAECGRVLLLREQRHRTQLMATRPIEAGSEDDASSAILKCPCQVQFEAFLSDVFEL